MAVMNAVRGVDGSHRFYEYSSKASAQDVTFELVDVDKIPVGNSVRITVRVQVSLNMTLLIKLLFRLMLPENTSIFNCPEHEQ